MRIGDALQHRNIANVLLGAERRGPQIFSPRSSWVGTGSRTSPHGGDMSREWPQSPRSAA